MGVGITSTFWKLVVRAASWQICFNNCLFSPISSDRKSVIFERIVPLESKMLKIGSIEVVTPSKMEDLPVGGSPVVEILRSFLVLRILFASFSQSFAETVLVGLIAYLSSMYRPLKYLLSFGKFIAKHDPR